MAFLPRRGNLSGTTQTGRTDADAGETLVVKIASVRNASSVYSALRSRPAAVNDQAVAGHVAGCRRGEKDGGAGNFFDLAEAAERDPRQEPRRDVRMRDHSRGQVGLDEAVGDGVDANPILGPIRRQ